MAVVGALAPVFAVPVAGPAAAADPVVGRFWVLTGINGGIVSGPPGAEPGIPGIERLMICALMLLLPTSGLLLLWVARSRFAKLMLFCDKDGELELHLLNIGYSQLTGTAAIPELTNADCSTKIGRQHR